MPKKQYLAVFLLTVFVPVLALARTSNDPYVNQWIFEDTGVYRAWDLAVGSKEVIVAIIDNGFDHFHPDIMDNVWKNEDEIDGNGLDDDKNGYIDDVWGWNFVVTDFNEDGQLDQNEMQGNNDPRPDVSELEKADLESGVVHHGTVVAGLIGAVGNNGLDGVGVNWNVRMMNLKVVDNSGQGELYGLTRAINYAIDNGADVINISMVGSSTFDELDQAIERAYQAGVVVVAAAGNGNIDLDYSPLYPVCTDSVGSLEKVLGVSAIEESHKAAYFTNNGATCVDITAPGVNVSSTQRFAPNYGLTTRYGGGWHGTSFAAPLVSGAVALIKSVQPNWRAEQIYQALLTTTHHTPGQDESIYARLFGAGLLQIDKALEYALAQPRELTAARKIMNISPDGYVAVYDTQLGVSEIGFNQNLKNIDAVAAGKEVYIVGKNLPDGTYQLAIFNKKWQAIKSFVVKVKGPMELLVADLAGDSGEEIVLAPRYASQTVFWLFDQNGTELWRQNLDKAHAGASIDLVENIGSRSELVAFYNHAGPQLVRFNNNFGIKSKILLDFPVASGAMRAGDIDDDGQVEYVIAARTGEFPYLAFYEDGATKSRLIKSEENFLTANFEMEIVDGDGDSVQEVMILFGGGSTENAFWSGSGLRKLSIKPFGMTVKNAKVLVY